MASYDYMEYVKSIRNEEGKTLSDKVVAWNRNALDLAYKLEEKRCLGGAGIQHLNTSQDDISDQGSLSNPQEQDVSSTQLTRDYTSKNILLE